MSGVCVESLWPAGEDSEVTEVNFSSQAGHLHMSSFWEGGGGDQRKKTYVAILNSHVIRGHNCIFLISCYIVIVLS